MWNWCRKFLGFSIVIFLASCAQTEVSTAIITSRQAEEPKGPVVIVDALQVEPTHVGEDEIFVMKVPAKHPSSFKVRTPDKKWVILQDLKSDILIMKQTKFDNLTVLPTSTKTLLGIYIQPNGKHLLRRVYQEPGEYLLYMADDLNAKPEDTFHMSTKLYYRTKEK